MNAVVIGAMSWSCGHRRTWKRPKVGLGTLLSLRYLNLLDRHRGNAVMCRRCEEIERQLRDYRRTYASIDDKLALSLLAEAIDDLKAEKASLHPTDTERS